MTQTLDSDAVTAAARRILDQRVTVVRNLVESRQRLIDARTALTEAERADTKAYDNCERAGWTADELRQVGLDAPTTRRPGRPKRGSAKPHRAAAETTAEVMGTLPTPGAE